jgi:hypothetical protein
MINIKYVFGLVLFFVSMHLRSEEYDGRYGWPVQKPPKGIIVCKPSGNIAEAMLLESLSGLAAKAVNEGKFDEMVWIDTDNEAYRRIYRSTLSTLNISKVKEMDLWSLLDYLTKRKVVTGYITYRLDKNLDRRIISDYSSNVATVYASLLSGVIIDESLVEQVKVHNLNLLKDVRWESLEECFEINKDKLNNCSALSIHPSVSNMRDYAIAHKLMLYADKKALIEKVLEWVTPMSPILGWGCGDEYDFTSLISEWGHYNTATDWCLNLPLISSISDKVALKKANEKTLEEIDFRDTSSFHSFVMSDGDNMQWTMGGFVDSECYAGNDGISDIGISWTLCPINLSIISPFTWNELAGKQYPRNSYIEYGGGYQYPDLFAIKRPNRKKLLREFAQRINYHLEKMDIKVFGFICRNVKSNASQEAFQIYAEELKGITGMLAVQYFPYELGGDIMWFTNSQGIDIPVSTATYSLWNEVNPKRHNCGTPEYISSLVNRDFIAGKQSSTLSWTIVHAWSDFSRSSKVTKSPAIGFNPVKATESLLSEGIKTVSANELLWRMRMKYRPDQTKRLKSLWINKI